MKRIICAILFVLLFVGASHAQESSTWSFTTYNTNEAMIGSDVTDKIAQGPVVINNGSTTVKASQGATITKNFQVSLGAEFRISNE